MLEGLSPDKRESLFHIALIKTRRLSAGSASADKKLRELLQQHGTFEEIYKAKEGSLIPVEGLLESIPSIDKVIRALKRADDFHTLTITSDNYPLKDIANATPVLYAQGNLDYFDTKTIAVVGTREPAPEDIEDGTKCLERLLKKNYTIVSGLAAGCDTLAHEFAVNNGGRTIAVLGRALDKYYPQENKDLQDKIAKEHLLVSQYPIGITSYPPFFAHRNHTTVSLSKEGIVVIQAGDKSGTQHAIRHCVEQEKPLYVLVRNLIRAHPWVWERQEYIKERGDIILPDDAPPSRP